MAAMTIFERRKRILALLREQKSVRVGELAEVLDVSEGTIRNDLTAMEEEQQLVRVRGGARIKEDGQPLSTSFAKRARVNATVKRRIARWAANMVEDGDSILLDASSTVYHMAPFLQQVNNLTIITNGLEVARTLATNSNHTVILVGGILRPDGSSLIGTPGKKLLHELHARLAFLSCAGFTIEAGLTEVDIREVELKTSMVQASREVVALVDSSKFGKASLSTFAPLSQVTHLITDSGVREEDVDELREYGLSLTVCGETTASTYTPYDDEDQQTEHFTIGFANLSEDIPFAVEVRRGLEHAAQEAGNIDLVVADNRLDGEVAMHVADRLIRKQVDLAIEYQIDEKMGNRIMAKFRQANIPVIAVDIPMVGASFFGADNYHTGHEAGTAMGKWIRSHWQGAVERVLVLEEPRAGAQPAARLQGQLDGLQDVIGPVAEEKITYVDGGNTRRVSEERTFARLEEWTDVQRIAVLSFNDDNALGALDAARKAGREEDVVIVGQGADSSVRPEIRRPNARIIGSTSFMPENYGEALIEMAIKILRGEPVPPAGYINHVFINHDNIDLFYPQ